MKKKFLSFTKSMEAFKASISLRKTIILLVITTILLLGYVWTRTKAVELSYKYAKLSLRERSLIDQNHKLRLEVASLKSPARLTSISKKELKLKRTPQKNKIFVKWGSK
jgi:cell division protein FtsL